MTRRQPSQKSQSRSPAESQVRIIGGRWRSRRLPVLSADGLRPTGDRIRETLFNWLQPTIAESHCLDLFAGSGALGFEALSREAAHVTFVEKQREVAAQLTRNLSDLRASPQGELINQDALTFLGHRGQRKPYDIIFLDPPFQAELLATCLAKINAENWLKPGGHIYFEANKVQKLPPLPPHWQICRHKISGQVQYGLIESPSSPPPSI